MAARSPARSLWAELVRHYDRGVAEVAASQSGSAALAAFVDDERFTKTTLPFAYAPGR